MHIECTFVTLVVFEQHWWKTIPRFCASTVVLGTKSNTIGYGRITIAFGGDHSE